MNNREFYEKWGKSEELKVIVNAIVYRGLQMYTARTHSTRDGADYLYLENVLSDSADDKNTFIKHVECYRDLIRMSDGFIKNVIKKVL